MNSSVSTTSATGTDFHFCALPTSIPFYLSSQGYGVFINTPGEVSMEVGAEKGSKVGTIVQGEELEYWLINGPSLKEVLGRYTVLTGRPGCVLSVISLFP